MTTRLRIHCLSLCVLAFALSGCVSTQADGPFDNTVELFKKAGQSADFFNTAYGYACLLYTSPSPRDQRGSRMPSSA